jgi:hypothetical protein
MHANFLFADLNNPNLVFEGSIVFVPDEASQFSIMALVQDQRLLATIPVISGKAPSVGN